MQTIEDDARIVAMAEARAKEHSQALFCDMLARRAMMVHLAARTRWGTPFMAALDDARQAISEVSEPTLTA